MVISRLFSLSMSTLTLAGVSFFCAQQATAATWPSEWSWEVLNLQDSIKTAEQSIPTTTNPSDDPTLVPTSEDEADNKDKKSKKKKRDYDVSYEGAPKDILPKLKIIASLENDKKSYPTSTALRRAANKDVEAFKGALIAAGYFKADPSFRLDLDGKSSPTIRFTINPGSAFRVMEHQIVYKDEQSTDRPSEFSTFAIDLTDKADGATLQANQQAFLKKLWDNGYPAAKITGRYAEADLEAGTATAVYSFQSGPKAFFGSAVVNGLSRTNDEYIRKLATWKEGDVYDKSKTIAYRDALSATNLFSAIDVAPSSTKADGETPILTNLQERKHRTIGAGLSFSTSEGPGARIFFENRNIFKRAERLRVDIEVSQIEQSVSALLEKPLLSLPGSAFAQGSFTNETTDAFEARTVSLGAGLSKFWLNKKLETRGGLNFETSQVSPNTGAPDEQTFFVSLPLSVTWNNEDSFLDPTKGVLASLIVTPTTGSDTFTQIETNIRTRLSFGKEKKFTTAVRGRLGASVGSSFLNLPINQRFFSGGGGSVRGYGFQLVGEDLIIEQDEEGELISAIPNGGRSVIEGAFEARYKLTEVIQVAAFIDSGSVSASATPDFNGKFFVGVGGGVRYLTPVGPLRVDIGIPITDRGPGLEDVDAPIQFLISLGQAF